MATQLERIEKLENKMSMFVTHEQLSERQTQHESEVDAMMANMSTRIDEVKRDQKAMEPILSGVDKNVGIILDRMDRPNGIRSWIQTIVVIGALIVSIIALFLKSGGVS